MLYGIITDSAGLIERKEPLFGPKQFCLDLIDQDRGLIGYAALKGNVPEKAIIPGQALLLGANSLLADSPADNQRPLGSEPASAERSEGLPNLVQGEGSYAFVYWEQAKQVLWIGTDRYGLQPLFYYHRDGMFAFATDLPCLVRLAPRKFSVNASAISQYICLRHPFGNETLFQEIRRASQGKLLRYAVKDDRLRKIPFFNYLDLAPDPAITASQVLAETPDRFRAALQRQIGAADKVLLPLSGGYDSRMIACGLHSLGVKLQTYTTYKDYRFTTDTVTAAEVAHLLDARHHYKALPPNYLARYHRSKCRHVNFETSYHTWALNLLIMLPAGPLLCLDGLGGDACLGASEIKPTFWSLWQKQDYRQLFQEYFRWYQTDYEQLIKRRYRTAIQDQAEKQVRRELKKMRGNPNGLIYLGLRNFTRRAIALFTFGIIGRQHPIRLPFFDHAFFNWLLSIPVPLKVESKIYAQLFKRFCQPTAAIPTTHQYIKGSSYFQKAPELWRSPPNRAYLAKTIIRLHEFLPGFIKPELPERLINGKIKRSERPGLLALADLAYWFETFQNDLIIKGWMT